MAEALTNELLFKKNKHKIMNDPSAGSPTETLLRLLVLLNDQVCPNSPL